jgi:hypothetical protein
MRYMNFFQRFYWELKFLLCDALGLVQCFPAFRRKGLPSKRRQIGLLTTTQGYVPEYPIPWNRGYVYLLSNSWSLQRIRDRGFCRNLWFPFRVCVYPTSHMPPISSISLPAMGSKQVLIRTVRVLSYPSARFLKGFNSLCIDVASGM